MMVMILAPVMTMIPVLVAEIMMIIIMMKLIPIMIK